jgi:PAS domain S-box-containing protein
MSGFGNPEPGPGAEDGSRLERQYKALIEMAADGILLGSSEGVITEANDRMCQIAGLRREELVGKHISEVMFAPESLRAAPLRFDLLRNGEIVVSERTVLRPDGARVEVEMHSRMMPDGSYQSIYRDVTERKRAEEALVLGRDRLARAELASGSGNWELDLVSRHFTASAGAHRIYGLEDEKMDISTVQSMVLLEDRPRMDKALTDLIEGKGPYDIEFRIKQEGTGRILDIRSVAEYDPARMTVFGVIQDVTERARMEGQIAQARKMESIGRLAGGVAHDFNNMLSVILGNAELGLLSLSSEEACRASLEAIQQAAVRSAELTRQLLAFARKQAVAPRVLDLNATVEGMLKMLRHLIGEDIELAWLPGTGPCRVRMDPSQLDQILANLSVNARDAISGVGRMEIRTGIAEPGAAPRGDVAAAERFVLLSISDDGRGMDEETKSKLFEPFFTTKELGRGTGLGLATVYGIVRQNGGSIEVRSEPGRGAVFRIFLPASSEEVEAGDAGPGTEIPRGRGETILIVEDEPPILALAEAMLKNLGYTVHAAASAAQALETAQSLGEGLSLIITDVIMPGMSGRELADRLSAGRCPRMKRLYMSGYTSDMIAERGVVGEGVDFIQKPFTIRELAVKTRAALSGR